MIFSGASAGAVGVYPNLDLVATKLPHTRVVGVIDSGWFLDSIPIPTSPDDCPDPLHCLVQGNLMRGVSAWNPAVDPDCANEKTAGVDLWQCLMGHYVEQFLSTPMFVFEWQFDLAQLYHDGITENPSRAPAELAYAQESVTNLTRTFVAAKKHHHFFSPACYQHVVLNNKPHNWVGLTINGTTLPDALDTFVKGVKNTTTVFVDTACNTPDCNPTCPPPQ